MTPKTHAVSAASAPVSPESPPATAEPWPSFLPRVRVEISLGALRRNAAALRRRIGVPLAFVVKKDAYGHGAIECARALEEEGADFFAVSCVSEGLELRRAGIRAAILVFGPVGHDEACAALASGLTLTVSVREGVEFIAAKAGELGLRAKVHLKVDTGMGRIGHPVERQNGLVRAILDHPSLDLEGVYSHLACADTNREMTLAQARRFGEFIAALPDRPPRCHLANSAGALLPECRFDMARVGIALYGASPLYPELEPVMTVRGRILQTRAYEPGETVSYGATYRVERPMRIAVVGMGYGDGLLRSLSNAGSVVIHGRETPIVGLVCMDQFMADVTGIPGAREGDEVLLFGAWNGSARPVWTTAQAAGSNAYEFVTLIGRLAGERRQLNR